MLLLYLYQAVLMRRRTPKHIYFIISRPRKQEILSASAGFQTGPSKYYINALTTELHVKDGLKARNYEQFFP